MWSGRAGSRASSVHTSKSWVGGWACGELLGHGGGQAELGLDLTASKVCHGATKSHSLIAVEHIWPGSPDHALEAPAIKLSRDQQSEERERSLVKINKHNMSGGWNMDRKDTG